ncbi:hypothetical protein NtRootA4_41660 (plasmid) [Arthrobacter sp. NtRootA4]|jgi:hypothetical protein|nr:hypothetical protein ARZXY2_4589 [Arthrobacter sp. ZXY-2]BCW17187.1 hypothetical protein NtRootA4_41660 [Arthrobacter sp. NtRootA4]BCW25295.1 hypothetical protein NtRootC7_41620 [Arthrobacter sp. NtRootC7]BCW29657.1 hypothetical protein NtRootC45_42570 [Arthrobacter sp. NtRootC45]
MPQHTGIFSKVITVDHRCEVDERLTAVVTEAMAHALRTSTHGIVVTRHDQRTFSVRLSPDISPGTTVERDLWRSNVGCRPNI